MAVGRVESVDADTGVLTVLASETEIELGDGIGAGCATGSTEGAIFAVRETLADSESRAGKDVQSGPVFGVVVDVGVSATLRDIDAVLDEDAGDVFTDMVGFGDAVGLEVVRVLVALARPEKFAARFTCGDEATTDAEVKRRGASNIMDSGMRLEGATSG
jgi:hypothetical protein